MKVPIEEEWDKFLHKYIYTGSKHETEDIVNFIFDHLKEQKKNEKKEDLVGTICKVFFY